MEAGEKRYLELLSRSFPTIAEASAEVINLSAILNLPKSTEFFASDIHGEFEAFSHILRNGSGSIRLKVDDVFGDTLSDAEKRALATLIYYPREKAKLALSQVEDEYAWYAVTVPRLVAVCKRAARKYTHSKIRRAVPSEFAYIVEELLTEDRHGVDKEAYYSAIIDAAVRYGRKVCFAGRSMVNVTRVAMSIGELSIPEENLIDVDDLENYADEEILVVTTGSQGEAMAGLTRMAYGEHRKLQIRPTDMVILSAHPIPGNEKPVARVINQLYRCGANVIYGQLGEVHVSGHACQEEIKLLHALVKPKYFLPIHGEYSKLWQHAELAEALGTRSENIVIPEIGQVIEMSQDSLAIVGEVPTGGVLVDGLGIGDVGNVVLRDRKHLSQDGLIIVVMAIDRDSGALVSGPDIISRGFVYVRENEDIIECSRELARNIVLSYGQVDGSEWQNMKNRIKDELHRYIFDKIKRNPMILPIIMEI